MGLLRERRAAAVVVAITVAIGVLACGGGGSSDEDQVKDTIKSYLSAIADGDGAKACDQLSTNGRTEIAQLGAQVGASTIDCEQIVQQLSSVIGSENTDSLKNAQVSSVQINGNQATATVSGANVTPTLINSDDHWLIDSGLLQGAGG